MEDYPYLQLHVTGLKDSYASGERIDFQVTQRAGGCTYPEEIVVKNLRDGSTVFEFNGTKANFLLFCPVVINPAEFGMLWVSDEWTESPIAISEPGTYAVIVKHLYMTVEHKFTVLEGVSYTSVVTIPQRSSVEESGLSFKPKEITVVISLNNTVKWINNDVVVHWIEATEGSKDDSGFYAATNDENDPRMLGPGDSFEYTFDLPGKYSYHSDPWNQGTVIVLPPSAAS